MMKKIVSMVMVLMLCLGMTLTASATTGEFVPSIGYKDNPIVVDAELEGEERDGEKVTDCIVVTNVTEAKEKTTDITQEERDALLARYEAILNGEKLPLDCDYVIIQLLDVNFKHDACRIPPEHGNKPEWLAADGTHITITFDLDVAADAEVDVLKYYEGAWEHLPSVVNNGDGTITCVYEDHFCPNAFVVKKCAEVPQTGDNNGARLMLWGGVFGACVLGLVAVIVIYSKKRRNA